MPSASKPTIELGPLRIDFLVEAEDSNGSVTVFECFVPAGSRVPVAHSHDGFEETAYVLEGRCTWTVDGETGESGVGESVLHSPWPGPHGFENRGEEDVRFLAHCDTPGCSGLRISRSWRTSSPAPAAARPTRPRSAP